MILTHICINDIFVDEQNGYRPNISTETTSYKLINEFLVAMNNKMSVGGIFCDLEKASDCINHRILLDKLEFCGIVGKFHLFKKSYVYERFQRVLTDNTVALDKVSYSYWEEVRSGVPQGSILVLCFFLLYINDLCKIVTTDANIILLADNKNIMVINSGDTHLKRVMNEIFMDINKWFTSNVLSLNFSKTHCLEFRTRNFKDNFYICYNKIPYVQEIIGDHQYGFQCNRSTMIIYSALIKYYRRNGKTPKQCISCL